MGDRGDGWGRVGWGVGVTVKDVSSGVVEGGRHYGIFPKTS